MSLEVQTDATSFEGAGYTTYGFEYEPSEGNTDGHIQWAINGTKTWRINDSAFGPSPEAGIGQRKVSVEPMYINLNLAISESISTLDPGEWELTLNVSFRVLGYKVSFTKWPIYIIHR
jgi:beta-glucanase (GH16 family)